MINSEVNKLTSVITHQPGDEFNNVHPINIKEEIYDNNGKLIQNPDFLLFDDLIYTEGAIAEHNQLTGVLESYSRGSNIEFNDLLNEINQNEYDKAKHPMINLIFTRDLGVVIGNTILVTWGKKEVRNEENKLASKIFNIHPMFKKYDVLDFHQICPELSIEGGDISVLDDKNVCIGISERTSKKSIEIILPYIMDAGFDRIYGIELQKKRAMMHLDTVFTQLSKEDFLMYTPIFENNKNVYVFDKNSPKGKLKNNSFIDELKTIFNNVNIIKCGGNEPINQDREQWTDGANALAIDNGVIILYTRNTHTINELKEFGYSVASTSSVISNPNIITGKTVITLDGPELCRGRGGARCLTLPLARN